MMQIGGKYLYVLNNMSESTTTENPFLEQITTIIENHIANEQFGVSELAEAMHMSRSNLLRKVTKQANVSVSQFIRQIRLNRAMRLLKESRLTVSEVAYEVGFNSTSYFIKCFREHYGYPPGEVGKKIEVIPQGEPVSEKPFQNRRRPLYGWLIAILGIAVVVGVWVWGLFLMRDVALLAAGKPAFLEKSIAVLPFKNESNDSSNVYLINGLMEATLVNLQKLKGLRVISRSSTEKFRNTSLSIPEMAKELNVQYFVDGSGQKIGNNLLLNIQLIDASGDRQLWAKQYRSEAKDIFQLQIEIAQNIVKEIQVIVSPEEKMKIEKQPTHNLAAYDEYLKAQHYFLRGGTQNLEAALFNYQKAIELDPQYALAYADAAMVCFYLDAFQTEKKYTPDIKYYAEKAFSIDPQLSESQIAKAVTFIHDQEYDKALPYLEKALEINPNSGLVLHFLTEFYLAHAPNTAKYLEYALMKVRVSVSPDSNGTSLNYLQVSNGFIQCGFVKEAMTYINKSLEYNPDNILSNYLKVFIPFTRNRDFGKTRTLLEKEIYRDTNNIVLLQELGKLCYMMKDYESAYRYYQKFLEIKEALRLDIYSYENLNIGIVFSKMGYEQKAQELIQNYKAYLEKDQSIYKELHLAMYFLHAGNTEKAMEHLKIFVNQDNFTYWVLLLDIDPLIEPIKDLPEFKELHQRIETKFWNNHRKIKRGLEKKGLL